MQIDKETRARAERIAREHGVDTVYVNDSNEFFLQKTLAMNSVGHKAERLGTVTVDVATVTEANNNGGGTESGTSSEVISEDGGIASETTDTAATGAAKGKTAKPEAAAKPRTTTKK